jgi:alpha-glucosidase
MPTVRRADDTSRETADWWRSATIYQVYVRSFADSDGDGVGDLDGVRERLGYLELLGVDALWLTDPEPETDRDTLDRLIAEAAGNGVRIVVESHLDVDSRLMLADFEAVTLRTAIDASLDAAAMADVPATWTLSNPDVVREATRYGVWPLGPRRARAMALVMLGLPGVVYLYSGSELGLPNVQPLEQNGSRVPLPWEGAEPPFGFSAGPPWLPMPQEWAKLTVERQLEDADSTLSLYRQAIELRKGHLAFTGGELEWYGAPAGCFAYRRKGGGLVCVLNASTVAVPLPAGQVLLTSGALMDGQLPPDTAAWLA